MKQVDVGCFEQIALLMWDYGPEGTEISINICTYCKNISVSVMSEDD